MPTVSASKFNIFSQDLGRQVHNLNTNVLKVGLTNVAPVATNTVWSDITEIATGNGYSAGGAACTAVSYSQTSGTAKLVATGPVFTATGAIGPFRYVVLYNSTASGGPLIEWADYGSALTMANTDTFTVVFDATNGVLTLV